MTSHLSTAIAPWIIPARNLAEHESEVDSFQRAFFGIILYNKFGRQRTPVAETAIYLSINHSLDRTNSWPDTGRLRSVWLGFKPSPEDTSRGSGIGSGALRQVLSWERPSLREVGGDSEVTMMATIDVLSARRT